VPLAPPDLRDGTLALRPPRPDDAAWVTAACRDPESHRWLPALPSPYTAADARRWIAQTEAQWEAGRGAPFAIMTARGDEGLGSIELRLLEPGLGEVGYWVSPEARGRGVATGALRLVAGWAFGELEIERLQLTTHPDNAASQRVAERVGFRREGILRRWTVARDGRRDAVMFSLLAGEFLGES
jgi:RimJ/RimL family protein N-acetyltransferase